MKKETFIKAIEVYQKQMEIDIANADTLAKVFKEAHSANLLYDNSLLSNMYLEILATVMNDTSNWIEYYCFDLNFGQENYRIKVTKDGKEIPLTTPEDLWNILTKKNEL